MAIVDSVCGGVWKEVAMTHSLRVFKVCLSTGEDLALAREPLHLHEPDAICSGSIC